MIKLKEKELKLVSGGKSEDLPASPNPNSPLIVADGKQPGTVNAIGNVPVNDTFAVHPYVNVGTDGIVNGGGVGFSWKPRNVNMRVLYLPFLAAYFISCAANATSPFIEYQIKHSNQTSCFDIELRSQIDQDGKFIVTFPIGLGLFHISSNGSTIKINETNNPYTKELEGDPHSNIQVKYSFCLENPKKSIEWPIKENDYFIFKIDKVLATPEHKDNEDWKIKIDLIDFPKDFNFFSSFNQNQKSFLWNLPISKFKNSMIVGGRISSYDFQFNQKPIFVIKLGNIESLSSNLNLTLEKLIKSQRTFWQDNDFENYLIVVHERPCDLAVSGASGIHPENAIILQFSNCGKKLDYINVYGISHELFHAWIGHKMAFPYPPGELQWFLEGVNDFFGLYFALKSNAISENDYIELYNRLIQFYYLLPINYLSNDQIRKNYFSDPFYHQLAQIRGHLFAKTLSFQIKSNISFVNIIKEIYLDYKKRNVRFIDKKDIDRVFHKYLNKKLWDNYVQYIYHGDRINLPEIDLEGKVKLIDEIVEVPDIGFDVSSLINEHTISLINPNSSAYKAGLRNGQVVKYHSISLINADRNMSVWVEIDGKIQEISFMPDRKLERLPQYKFIEVNSRGFLSNILSKIFKA